ADNDCRPGVALVERSAAEPIDPVLNGADWLAVHGAARAQTIALAARLVQPCRNVPRGSIFGSKYRYRSARASFRPDFAMQRGGEQSSRSIIVIKIGRPRQSRA